MACRSLFAHTLSVILCVGAAATSRFTTSSTSSNLPFATYATGSVSPGGCTGGGNHGCSPPIGDKWDRWDMAGSTYAYCYAGCHMPWFIANKETQNLSAYAGLVGVDHYWTGQGVPCDPTTHLPNEFDEQDKLAIHWKGLFPGMRYLAYRIPSAVPYDAIIHNKIISKPEYFVRWEHKAGSSEAGNGSVCFNYESPCFNDPHRINNPAHNCLFEIRAAAYNWLNKDVGDWYIDNVIMPTLVHGDGMWLDGNGYDNGAWMCSGICCGFNASNSPQNQSQIDGFCAIQQEVATKARQKLISNGGFDGLNCMHFLEISKLPRAEDTPASCEAKLRSTATWGANHSNFNAVVAYGYDTGAGGYNDTTAAAAVAAFMLMRGQHWFFGLSAHNPCNPRHYPVEGRCHSDDPNCHSGMPCNSSNNVMDPATAALLVTDYGKPVSELESVPDRPHVFARKYEKATVTLDCNTFRGDFRLN